RGPRDLSHRQMGARRRAPGDRRDLGGSARKKRRRQKKSDRRRRRHSRRDQKEEKMKDLNWTVLMITGLALAASANAADHVTVSGHLLREHVRQATVVEFPPFSVTVPAHWSFQAMIHPKPVGSDGMTIDFITAPGNLLKSKLYVGVRERQPKMTLEERQKGLSSERGHHSRTVQWNGQTWLIDEFQGVHPHMTTWTAYSVRSGKEYLMLAESPNAKRPKYAPKIFSIMRSVKFSSHAPATRAGSSGK